MSLYSAHRGHTAPIEEAEPDDECRMSNDERNPNDEFRRKPASLRTRGGSGAFQLETFEIRISSFFRHSLLVIRH